MKNLQEAYGEALEGQDRDVTFRQVQEQGCIGLSDVTEMSDLAVRISAAEIDHRLYHFRLAYSGFERVRAILGGENYGPRGRSAERAVLGGVPREHRSDGLSAAFCNLDREGREDPTHCYDALYTRTTAWNRLAITAVLRTKTAPSKTRTAT